MSDTAVRVPQALRSLRTSKVRSEIALYLYKIHPEASYPAEISRNTGSDPSTILGGLSGELNNYLKSNSLIDQGIVDKTERNGKTYYVLSEFGKSLIEKFKV